MSGRRVGGSPAGGRRCGGREIAAVRGGFGYDRLAGSYRWLEALAFGAALQRARLAHLEVALGGGRSRRALLLGEGDGRFAAALAARAPHCELTVVDGSRAMLEAARDRLQRAGASRVRFAHCDLRRYRPEGGFDLIVTCFVLDLFEADTLQELVPRWAAALAPGGRWLQVDFAVPAAGWRRRRARLWLALLYRAFGATTAMEARRLVPAGPLLRAAGLRPRARAEFSGGLLASSVWHRSAPEQRRPLRPPCP